MDISIREAQREFGGDVAFLNTATYGLPPRAAHEAVLAAERDRAAGLMDPAALDGAVARSRAAFARLLGVPAARVACGPQASYFVGLVAASLPEGATVLVADGDFTSLLFPFAARPGLVVRPVPLERIAEAVRGDVDVVAVSAVQSSDGRVAPCGSWSRRRGSTGRGSCWTRRRRRGGFRCPPSTWTGWCAAATSG
ncbi:hypothetical protein [Actinomadura graeca]|uniref:hypothetical protein n=1 Tax=Actinomadura graeca TaxID=2750812 RepID=UPI0030844116